MIQHCQACERNAVTVVESCDDPDEPYYLCAPCHHRLHARSLRPLEWYNLAKRHGGYQYLLHDDFYDDDGTAHQPEEEVSRPSDFPFPSLESVASDSSSLLDYSIARWHLTQDLSAAWQHIDRGLTLSIVAARYTATRNAGIRTRMLEICAASLKEFAAQFVRSVWGDYPEHLPLLSLAKSSAECLPMREGFDRVVTALDALPLGKQRESMYCLSYFHSSEALDWIERHINPPVSDHWGRLAAQSSLAWPRVAQWLSWGRPLSLVALSALVECVRDWPPAARAPRLLQPPNESALREVLTTYAARDSAPRVQDHVGFILSRASRITQAG